MKIIHFKKWTCQLEILQYGNGRPSIVLNDLLDGDRVCVASINIPEVDLKEDEVVIKNYSENEGLLEVLIKEGVISKPKMYIRLNYTDIPICQLLIKNT